MRQTESFLAVYPLDDPNEISFPSGLQESAALVVAYQLEGRETHTIRVSPSRILISRSTDHPIR